MAFRGARLSRNFLALPIPQILQRNRAPSNGRQRGQEKDCREGTPSELGRYRGFGFVLAVLQPFGQLLIRNACPISQFSLEIPGYPKISQVSGFS